MKFFPVMDFNRVGVFSFENIVDANGDAVSGDAGNGDGGNDNGDVDDDRNLDTNGDSVYENGNAKLVALHFLLGNDKDENIEND